MAADRATWGTRVYAIEEEEDCLFLTFFLILFVAVAEPQNILSLLAQPFLP